MPTKLTDEQVAEMKAAAELATPGPWAVWREPTPTISDAIDELAFQVTQSAPFSGAVYLLDAGGKCPATTGCGPTSADNAAHIALCDPTTILSILTELTDLRERLGSLSAETSSPPITRLLPDNGKPEWQQIDDLFARYGLAPSSTRLRDELVTHLVWARYGQEILQKTVESLNEIGVNLVKVKQLEWEDDAQSSYAHSILGPYHIALLPTGWAWNIYRCAKREEAKTAAQRDFDARILSALHS